MHTHAEAGVVWYGGIGHRLLGADGGSECFRCGMFVDNDAIEEFVPDCGGPDLTGHHWLPDGRDAIECAYGDARVSEHFNTGIAQACDRA